MFHSVTWSVAVAAFSGGVSIWLASTRYQFFRSLWIPTSQAKLEEAEKLVMKTVKSPFQQRQVEIGNNLYINTVHLHNNSQTVTI
ncbi:unnamed protein product, partial [Didymodactylos carnosus]